MSLTDIHIQNAINEVAELDYSQVDDYIIRIEKCELNAENNLRLAAAYAKKRLIYKLSYYLIKAQALVKQPLDIEFFMSKNFKYKTTRKSSFNLFGEYCDCFDCCSDCCCNILCDCCQ